jgi:3-deoxy-D-manno-octulosonic-acid transferase
MNHFANLLLWFIYYPLLKFLSFWIAWLPDIQERKRFESKNKSERLAQSFRHEKLRADLCFEFSSEGEYQQVASLIQDALGAGKKIELVFFSPSVEKSIIELAQRHPQQIRYFRYPLATFSPTHSAFSFSRWVTAPVLVMVRYDLFPEFLVWAMRPGHTLKMVWVTFKKEREKGRSVSWFKRLFLKHAHRIFYASPADAEQGMELACAGINYDFRIEQIRRRILLRQEKFSQRFAAYAQFRQQLELWPRHKRLVMGNAWPEDLHLLQKFPSDMLLVIVPHQLTPEILEQISDYLESIGRLPVEISDATEFIAPGPTYLINKKGVLCELYSDFGKAYVGGGFGESVHSILEPLVAGSEHIACGPVHHRSTEYDLADTCGQMTEVRTHEDFNRWLHRELAPSEIQSQVNSYFELYASYRKDIISC